MALAGVCKIENEPYMQPFNTTVLNNAKKELEECTPNILNPYMLCAPPFENPLHNFQQIQSDAEKYGVKFNFDHGTTTLSFKYQGGIVVAVDSRATGGQYIGSQSMKKVVEINKNIIGTLAGGAADCVYWDRVLTKECRLYELRNKSSISVTAASKIIANICYDYKGMGLSMGMMLAGYDGRGPGLYYVDSEGTRLAGERFSVGSGSIYAYGILDTYFRWDMTDEEAYELGRRAIYHATYKDAYSGGIIRVYHVNKEGWSNISNTDCYDLHYKYEEERTSK